MMCVRREKPSMRDARLQLLLYIISYSEQRSYSILGMFLMSAALGSGNPVLRKH